MLDKHSVTRISGRKEQRITDRFVVDRHLERQVGPTPVNVLCNCLRVAVSKCYATTFGNPFWQPFGLCSGITLGPPRVSVLDRMKKNAFTDNCKEHILNNIQDVAVIN